MAFHSRERRAADILKRQDNTLNLFSPLIVAAWLIQAGLQNDISSTLVKIPSARQQTLKGLD